MKKKGDNMAASTAQASPAKAPPMTLRKIRFTQEDIDFLDAECEREDRNFNWMVRKAVREYREKHSRSRAKK